MDKKFSIQWNKSKQPRKQRKYLANAPLHIKRKMLSATLSKELRKKYKRRSIEVRKNDEVKVLRGGLAGKQGKVSAINKRKFKIAIENIQKTKKDGTKVNVWFHAPKLIIVNLNTDDKKRLKTKQEVSHEKKEKPKEEKNAHNKK